MADKHNAPEPSTSLSLLVEIVRCPECVRSDNTRGKLKLVRENTWLVCQDCERKYPVPEDIPVLLVDEGTKWMATPIADLPVPPPMPE
jgi:uncharacterized protein YbaR (Trm112 family)